MKLFDLVSFKSPKSSMFDLTHEHKMSMNMGALVPCLVQDVLPGDSWRGASEVIMRYAPMLAPMMHQCNAYIHYFYVPNRLVWPEFAENFITGGRDGLQAPVAPYFVMDNTVTAALCQEGSLYDHMGLPPYNPAGGVTSPPSISALPFRAYQMIYDEYYRDTVLEAPVAVSTSAGLQNSTERAKLLQIRTRAWEKDYFTSARPNAQLGAPVTVPVSGTGTANYKATMDVRRTDGSVAAANLLVGTLGAGIGAVEKTASGASGVTGRIENIQDVTLSNASMLVNDLRTSIKIQEWQEKNSVGGSRFYEQILAHWGVRVPDSRVQRPEYLGGGKTPVVISEVLSTYQTAAENIPQGNMAGHGVSVGQSNRFKKFFYEHGWIIGIMSVIPRTAYQQGIERKFTRATKFDYATPELAQIGEQSVLSRELYWTPTSTVPEYTEVFGYQSRYAEYKYQSSIVSGAFRSSLNFWHMGRIFSSKPTLQTSFVQSDPTFRIFAVITPTVDHLYVSVLNKLKVVRKLPYYGTPRF